MEKLLFVTQLLPYPPHSGGKYKTYQILKLLTKMFAIHLFCFYDKKSDKKYIKELENDLKITVTAIYQPLVTSRHTSVKSKYIWSLLSAKPFSVFKYQSKELTKAIQKSRAKNQYSYMYCDHETSFQFVEQWAHTTPIIYDEHNLHSVSYQRVATLQKNFLLRVAYYYESLKHRLWEQRILKSVKKVAAISQTDATTLKKRTKVSVLVLPVPFTIKNLFRFPTPKRILFIGMLSWPPNKNGLLWFINKVFPVVLKLAPDVHLDIVGANADEELIRACRRPHIHLHGEVADLEKFYQKASLVIAPILSGSGVRIKILHALAAGIPVVSTNVGREGITRHRSGVMTANNPTDFAQAICQLTFEKKVAFRYSKNALAFMKENYSKSSTLQILQKLFF